MYTYDVFIAVRQKSRQSTLCIIIKGIEKFISNIYEARYQLLKMSGPRVVAEVPATYFNEPNERNVRGNSVVSLLASTGTNNLQVLSPLPPMHWVPPVAQRYTQNYGVTSTSMPNISNIKDHRHQNMNLDKNLNVSPRNISISSGYQSINCSTSSSSIENNLFNQNLEHPSKLMNDHSFNDSSSDATTTLNDSLIFNFDRRIIDGYNAMRQSPSQNEIRTPTHHWQGLGLSKTSPHPVMELHHPDNDWPQRTSSPFTMTTSVLDAIPKQQRERLAHYSDVTSILLNLGLGHYIGE